MNVHVRESIEWPFHRSGCHEMKYSVVIIIWKQNHIDVVIIANFCNLISRLANSTWVDIQHKFSQFLSMYCGLNFELICTRFG